jgi:hypothetical protein
MFVIRSEANLVDAVCVLIRDRTSQVVRGRYTPPHWGWTGYGPKTRLRTLMASLISQTWWPPSQMTLASTLRSKSLGKWTDRLIPSSSVWLGNSATGISPRPLTVEVSRFDGVRKVTNCRQVFFHICPKYRVVIAKRKSQKPLLCGASPLVVSFGV